MSDTVTVIGLEERKQALHRMMSSSPGMDKRLRAVIRKCLASAKKSLQAEAASGLGMKSDPRKAYKAVRHSVYKRILGGNLNILQKRTAGSPGNYAPPRKNSHRGGNRWGRSERTKSVQGYTGEDRGFILRFLNVGTDGREIHSYTDKDDKKHNLRSGNGNRGSIASRDWFGNASVKQFEQYAQMIENVIDDILKEEFF